MDVEYKKTIPFPPSRILSQYFDLEHIAHVHPRSFGEARLVTTHANSVVWEHLTPRFLGLRLRNRIAQEYVPPDLILTRVIRGPFRGVEVVTRLEGDASGTLVDETYRIPLPNWSWLESIVRRWLVRRADRIWEEEDRKSVV